MQPTGVTTGLFQLMLPLALYLGATSGAGWGWWLIAVFFYAVVYNIIEHNIGFHRCLMHGQFSVAKPIEWLFVWIGSMLMIGSPLSYSVTHVIHHKYPDTELDPHSPIKGLWWSYLLWQNHKFDLAKDVTMDVGYLRYQYQGYNLEMTGGTARSIYGNANTNEIYTAITMGPITAKYSYSLGDLFGYIDSKGSGYLDLSANFEVIPTWTVTPHFGRQTVTAATYNASYNDMSLTVTKDFGKGLTTSLSYHGTNAEGGIYSSSFDGKYLGDRGAVIGIKYTF